jgi:hypothetical protein
VTSGIHRPRNLRKRWIHSFSRLFRTVRFSSRLFLYSVYRMTNELCVFPFISDDSDRRFVMSRAGSQFHRSKARGHARHYSALPSHKMDWHYSDHSDDEAANDVQPTNRKRSSRGQYTPVDRLSSLLFIDKLACDQCRKTKSKCERPAGNNTPCKSCILAGTGSHSIFHPEHPFNSHCCYCCTSLYLPRHVPSLAFHSQRRRPNPQTSGPSYKRGPPKGYIHAIEQRWHQVESLLGAIIQCPDPTVQSLVSALSQDELAREIIRRVDNGPYVRLFSISSPVIR